MSDLFGNHIVGFPTRRLKCWPKLNEMREEKIESDFHHLESHNEEISQVSCRITGSLSL